MSALQSALTIDEVAGAFMSTVTEVLPATNIALYRLDGQSGAVLGLWTDAEGRFVDEYEQYGRANDPVLDFVRLQHRPIDSDRVAAPGVWESSGARATLLNAGLAHSLEAPLTASGVFVGTINFARPASIAAFSEANPVEARLVSEQLSLATERAIRFERTGQRVNMMERALDRLPQHVIVTDLDARVLFKNRAARNGETTARPDELDAVAESIAEAMTEFRLRGRRVFTSSLQAADSTLKIIKSYRLGDSPDAAVTMIFNCRAQDGPGRLPAWDVLSRREQERSPNWSVKA